MAEKDSQYSHYSDFNIDFNDIPNKSEVFPNVQERQLWEHGQAALEARNEAERLQSLDLPVMGPGLDATEQEKFESELIGPGLYATKEDLEAWQNQQNINQADEHAALLSNQYESEANQLDSIYDFNSEQLSIARDSSLPMEERHQAYLELNNKIDTDKSIITPDGKVELGSSPVHVEAQQTALNNQEHNNPYKENSDLYIAYNNGFNDPNLKKTLPLNNIELENFSEKFDKEYLNQDSQEEIQTEHESDELINLQASQDTSQEQAKFAADFSALEARQDASKELHTPEQRSEMSLEERMAQTPTKEEQQSYLKYTNQPELSGEMSPANDLVNAHTINKEREAEYGTNTIEIAHEHEFSDIPPQQYNQELDDLSYDNEPNIDNTPDFNDYSSSQPNSFEQEKRESNPLKQEHIEPSGKNSTEKLAHKGNKDSQSQSDIDKYEAKRNAELKGKVNAKFQAKGDDFYYKDGNKELAFKDKGTKLETSSNDKEVAIAMAQSLASNGAKAINLKGHPNFKREVWLEASALGVQVQGFKPTEKDLAELSERKEQEMGNSISVKPEPEKTNANRNNEDHNKSNGISGKVLEHGEASYQNKPGKSQSYFIKLATDNGEKTVWGKDLQRAMNEGKFKTNDNIELTGKGTEPVSFNKVKRDSDGQVISKEVVNTTRNKWEISSTDKLKEVTDMGKTHTGKLNLPPEIEKAVAVGISTRATELNKSAQLPSTATYNQEQAPSSLQVEKPTEQVKQDSGPER